MINGVRILSITVSGRVERVGFGVGGTAKRRDAHYRLLQPLKDVRLIRASASTGHRFGAMSSRIVCGSHLIPVSLGAVPSAGGHDAGDSTMSAVAWKVARSNISGSG